MRAVAWLGALALIGAGLFFAGLRELTSIYREAD